MSEMNNEGLTAYLDAAINMGFEGSSMIDGKILYLQGSACRLAYEGIPDEAGTEGRADAGHSKWIVHDLAESVPAKMIITADHRCWLQGPYGSGMQRDDDFDGWLLFPVKMEGVADFKRLYPLIIDVLAAEDITPDELKQKSEALHALLKEFQMRQAFSEEEAKEKGVL